jgi:hypothetical protein
MDKDTDMDTEMDLDRAEIFSFPIAENTDELGLRGVLDTA